MKRVLVYLKELHPLQTSVISVAIHFCFLFNNPIKEFEKVLYILLFHYKNSSFALNKVITIYEILFTGINKKSR